MRSGQQAGLGAKGAAAAFVHPPLPQGPITHACFAGWF